MKTRDANRPRTSSDVLRKFIAAGAAGGQRTSADVANDYNEVEQLRRREFEEKARRDQQAGRR